MDAIIKKRIRIYTNVRTNLELAKNMYEKHMAEGDHSLLLSIEDFSWAATGPKINFCLEKHKEAISLSKNLEEMFRQRDAVLAEITDILIASKSLLKNKYSMSPEKLREWGIMIYEHSNGAENIPP
jgi:hypothetical protein